MPLSASGAGAMPNHLANNPRLGLNAPWREQYPFASHFAEVDGRLIHYVDEGAGDPVLMVHGNPTWSFHWRKLISALCDKQRMIAVDHLGCGLSEKPQQADYTLEGHIARLATLVDELDLRNVTLVAQDWGGPIGLGTLLARRDRFKRIVLLNTGAFPPPYIPWRIRVCRRNPLLVRGLNAFSLAALRMTMLDPDRLNDKAKDGYLAPYNSWSNRVAVANFVNDIPPTSGSKSTPTLAALQRIERELPQLPKMPVSFVWGMLDWCFRPECLTRLEKMFPHADATALADAGHWVMEDAPQTVIDAVRRTIEKP